MTGVLLLQRIIFLVVFGKILQLMLGWNSLQRVITKASAVVGGRNDAAFLANNLFLIDLSREAAIGTVSLHFFAE